MKRKHCETPKENEKLIFSVPWRNKAEFTAVRLSLFSDNIEKIEWALERIIVWKSKAKNCKLMKAIDVTGVISRAQLMEMKYQKQPTINYEAKEQLTTHYGIALIRFVALATSVHAIYNPNEPIQTKLKILGIPDWLGQVRNDLSHHIQPSLYILRTACTVAMQWIKLQFWDVKDKSLIEYVPLPLNVKYSEESMEMDIWNTLSLFQEVFYKKISDSNNKSKIIRKVPRSAKSLISQLRNFLTSQPKTFINILAESDFLVMRYDNLDAILPKEDMDFLDGDSINLPSTLENFGMPVLSLFKSSASLQPLLETIITKNADQDKLSQRLSTAWVYKLASVISLKDDSFFGCLPQLDWFSLLEVSLKMPNEYSPPLVSFILDQLEFEEPLKHTLMALVAIKLGSTTDSTIKKKSGSRLYKDDDLREVFEKVLKNKSKNTRKGPWSHADSSISWHKIPIGGDISAHEQNNFNSDNSKYDNDYSIDNNIENVDKIEAQHDFENENDSVQIEIQDVSEEKKLTKSTSPNKKPGTLDTMQLIVF